MTEIINALTNVLVADKIVSKVDGRRNWVIRVQVDDNNNPIMYCGGYGEMGRWGMLTERLDYMGKHKVNWFKFTYKADYLRAIEMLKLLGYVER